MKSNIEYIWAWSDSWTDFKFVLFEYYLATLEKHNFKTWAKTDCKVLKLNTEYCLEREFTLYLNLEGIQALIPTCCKEFAGVSLF